MFQEDTSPLVESASGSILEDSSNEGVEKSSAMKNFALLAGLAKLPYTATEDTIGALQTEVMKASATIRSTGGTEKLEEEAKSRELKRTIDVGAGAKLGQSETSDWLAKNLMKVAASKNNVERQAAETLTLLPDTDEEVVMPLSALELRQKITERRVRLMQESYNEGNRRGLDPVSERSLGENILVMPRDILGMIVPVFSTIPLAGNVPGIEENILDQFLPGKVQNKEAEALFDPDLISDDEFDRLLPEVVKNTFDNTIQPVTFGLLGENEIFYQNKLYQEMLIHNYLDKPNELETNLFAAADAAGILYPLAKMGARGLSSLDILKGMRANSLVDRLTVDILNKAKTSSLSKAAEEAGTTISDVESIALPKVVSPENSTITGVARVDATAQLMAEIDEVAKAAGITNLDDLARLQPEELKRAVAATLKDTEKRLNRKIKAADVEEYNATPGTGIYTPALRITLGVQKGGGGFKTLAGALKYADNMGLSDIQIVKKYVQRAREDVVQPELARVSVDLDEVFQNLPTKAQNLPENLLSKKTWMPKVGYDNTKVFDDIKTFLSTQSNDAVEVLVTRDGNILASPFSEFGGELKNAYKLTDQEVGRVVITAKDVPPTLDKLYQSVRTSENKRFALKGDKLSEPAKPVASVVRDENSGEHFLVFETGVVEKGFFDPLETISGAFGSRILASMHMGLARVLAGGRLIETGDMYGRAVLGEARRNALINLLNKRFAPRMRALNDQERSLLNTIARVEDKEQRWFPVDELKQRHFEKFGFGSDPEKFVEAHKAFKEVNDIDWRLRNALVYSDLMSRGFRQVGLKEVRGVGNFAAKPASVHADLGSVNPQGLVFNSKTGKMETWGSLDKKALSQEDYVLVRYHKNQQFGAGKNFTRDILVPKSSLEDAPLSKVQLGYRPGGHRIYSDRVRWWVKGARYVTQDADGSRVLLEPMTLKGGLTHLELEKYIKDLNDYVDLAEAHRAGKKGNKTQKALFNKRSENPELPTVDDILKMVDDGRASTKYPFEIVEDRKFPSQYQKDTDAMLYADESANPVYDNMHDTGRLYYSSRGDEVVTDFAGNELPVMDVTETINQALNNISRTVSFNSYKVSKMERWVETFKDLLDLKPNMTLDQQFNAPFRTNLGLGQLSAKNIANTQRSVTRRLLNWTSPETNITDSIWNQILLSFDRNIADDVDDLGEAIESKRKAINGAMKFGEIFGPNKTLQFMRGWAFDAKLGFLNIAQIPLQLATTLDLVGIDSTKSLRAIQSYLMLGRMFNPEHNHTLLRQMFETPAGKAFTGFDDVEELIMMYDQMKRKTGYSIVNRTQAVLDQATEGNLFGLSNGIVDKARAVREFTRAIFYETEKMNKSVAWQVSWRQVREEFPQLSYNSQKFIEKVSARASTLSRGMDNASSAAWQKGWTSAATQFWTYPIRSLELFLGKELTPIQKTRFALTQALMYGVAAPPLVGSVIGPVVDGLNKENGVPTMDDDPFHAFYQRGMIDTLIYHTSGADVLYGDRASTGRFFSDTLAELFGMGRYGPTSPAEMAGGASLSIFFDTANGFGSVGNYFARRWDSDLDPDEGWDILMADLSETARVVSTWNNATKAMAADQAGMMWSRRQNGKDVYLSVADLNGAEAVALAFGLNPAESLEVSAALADSKSRKASIQYYVSAIKDTDLEMITAFKDGDMAKVDKLGRRIQVYLEMAKPELRTEIREQLDRYDYRSSMSKSVVDAWLERQQKDKFIREVDQQLKERE